MNLRTAKEILSTQKEKWDSTADGWENWRSEIQRMMRPIGEELTSALRLVGEEKVLDVACGNGEPGLTIAEQFPMVEVHGIDLSPNMVELANEAAKSRDLVNYIASAASAEAVPYDDNTFDAVVCRFGIMFFPDPEKAVREFMRVLKPGGRIAVSAWGEAEDNPWASRVMTLIRDRIGIPKPGPDEPNVFRFAEEQSLSSLLSLGGAHDIWEKHRSGLTIFGPPEEYWQMIKEAGGGVKKALEEAGEAKTQRVRQDVLRILQNEFSRDGRVMIEWTANIAGGEKGF